MRFGAEAGAFGQSLRGGRYAEDNGYDGVIALAQVARGEDPFDYRAGFRSLVRLAKTATVTDPVRR